VSYVSGQAAGEFGNVLETATCSSQDVPDAKPAAASEVDARPAAASEVDAKPAAASEVDAQKISWPRFSQTPEPILVPSSRFSQAYDLAGLKRVIILNQKAFATRLKLNTRNGTEVDVAAITSTFKSLDWEVLTYTDSTVAQIREIMLNQVCLCQDDLAALAIFILSHGEDNGTLFASDYPFRVDHDILAQMAGDKCPGLVGRPKLVFIQACQGQATDPGVGVSDRRRRHTSQDSSAAYRIPNYADFLIFQASFWDHYSFRSSETGSWFIQALCSKLNDSQAQDPLLDILLQVSAFIALDKESNVPGRPHLDKKKQVPLLYSTMLRKMYLKGSSTKALSSELTTEAVAHDLAELNVQQRRSDKDLQNVTNKSGSPKFLSRDSKEKDCLIM